MADLHLSVTVEGVELSHFVERVEVEENDSLADLATVRLADADRVLSDLLHEGLALEVELGWSDGYRLAFRGIITGIRAHFPERGTARVVIQGVDTLILLGLQHRTKRWWNKSVSQIVQEIVSANGLTSKVSVRLDETIDEKRPRQQIEETDLAFLHRLAEDYDCKLWVEHGEKTDTVYFKSTEDLLSADPVTESLDFARNVLELNPSFDAFATAPSERTVASDPLTGDRVEIKKTLTKPTDATWVPDAERIAKLGDGAAWVASLLAKTAAKRAKITDFWHVPPRTAGAPSRPSGDHARVVGDRARRLGQTVEGRADGSIYLTPRRKVKVNGYGGRWSGDWYLARVRHELDRSERRYTSAFVCTR